MLTAAREWLDRATVRVLTATGGEEGQTMVEYILIIAVIAIAAMVAMGLFEDEISAKFQELGNRVSGA